LVAVFAKLVLPGGSVLGLEKVPELVSTLLSSTFLLKSDTHVFDLVVLLPVSHWLSSFCSFVNFTQAQRSISSIQTACPDLQEEQGKGWRVEHGNALSGTLTSFAQRCSIAVLIVEW
jgi:hypothetical protein